MNKGAVSPDEFALVPVEIYSWQYCGYCVRAKQLLTAKGMRYIEYMIDGDDAARAYMVQRTGGRRSLPQIFINGQHVGGWDELFRLESTGRLDALLYTPAPVED